MATVMAQPVDDLSSFVDTHADRNSASDLISLGPRSLEAYYRIGNEGLTRSLLATNFWRSWIASEQTLATLVKYGAHEDVLTSGRVILVARQYLNRFDLLVLDPALESSFTPATIDASTNVSAAALRAGAQRAIADGVPGSLGKNSLELAVESFAEGRQPFAVVLASAPATERLTLPNGPVTVDDGNETSTAGIVVRDTANHTREGVTVALHAIQAALGPGGTVNVNGSAGSVARSDAITDSAFVELSASPKNGIRTTQGVMKGFAPRGNQGADFDGITSGRMTTTVTGWDHQIPTPSTFRQACIYTGRDAQPGDSGAALVTDDDWIIGFAFERTRPGQSPAYCSWIWADSVMSALGIEPA